MKVELQERGMEKVEIPDLRRLKELSKRLRLSPKRESVIQWKNDLKELQSEGIYPIPIKPNEKFSPLKENLSPTTAVKKLDFAEECDTNLQENKTDLKKCERLEQITDEVETEAVLSTIDNLKRKNKSGVKTAQKHNYPARNASSHTGYNKKGDGVLRRSNASSYFRQRSSEDCQSKIKQYALRLETDAETEGTEEGRPTTGERFRRIGLALERLRTDLLDMRIQDNNIARQLLEKRHELVEARAQKTCDEYATMLDDFTWELELEDELSEQLRSFDLPSTFLRGPDSLLGGCSPLRLIGINRMTMDSKRFSVI